MTDFQAVHARQHPVQDHNIGRVIARQDQAAAAVGGRIHGVALVGQSPLQQLQDRLIIFNDQDALVHRSRSVN